MRLLVGYDTIEEVRSVEEPERGRQVLGLRLANTLVHLGLLEKAGGPNLDPFEPILGVTSDERFGWPFADEPDSILMASPGTPLPRDLARPREIQLSPWALHSLFLGDWGPLHDGEFRLPSVTCLLLCDGIMERPVGRDLLRVTSEVEVLDFPARLHSFPSC